MVYIFITVEQCDLQNGPFAFEREITILPSKLLKLLKLLCALPQMQTNANDPFL